MELKLKLSKDRKVSTLSRFQLREGKAPVAKPKVANAFGLPAIKSCPDFTAWCESVCYAFNLQRAWTTVDNLVTHNLNLLLDCGSNVSKMVALLDDAVSSVNWYGTEKVFRWHWDGDVFSRQYARAIAQTCLKHPDTQFWIYTRSFRYVADIIDIPNLTVYLSVDPHNIKAAKDTYKAFPNVLIAACADTWDESESIMREVVGRNAPRCPELTGKVPLVSPNGEGACVTCGLCIYGRNHVRFASN